MRKKAAGFYADSLEMLLDTMCNILGGILFITLTLAMLTHHSSTPEAYQQQAAQLTNELAAVTSSNAVVTASIQQVLQQLQNPQRVETNQMHLPNLSQTTKIPWNLIVRYGGVYSLDLPPAEAHAALIKNTQTIDWRGSVVEPKRGQGGDPVRSVEALAQAFRRTSQTNYYFVFYVYEDSFADFNRAKELAFNLGIQYGWEPVPNANPPLSWERGRRILPQN